MLVYGSTLVSSCVHPVAILRAVFCTICSLSMFVSDALGDHMVEAYSSTGLVMVWFVDGLWRVDVCECCVEEGRRPPNMKSGRANICFFAPPPPPPNNCIKNIYNYSLKFKSY